MVPIIANTLHSNRISQKGQKLVSREIKRLALFTSKAQIKIQYTEGKETLSVMLRVLGEGQK